MATANIKAVITADDRASSVLKKFGTQASATSSTIGQRFKENRTAILAATAGIVAFGKSSLDAFNQQDLAVARLRAGINNVKSATDKNIDSLLAQASALQKNTRFADEAYISAQGILTTFQLNQKAIEKLTPRLADMSEGIARVSGGLPDLEGNAILVAKAIGGEDVAGLTGALRRVGVVMTKTQEELLQTGSVEERVSIVTQILDQNFQGMAEAAGDTTAGKIAILKNNFNDLQEKVGGLIATGLTPLLNLLNQHPLVLQGVTLAVGGLTLAFVALKINAILLGPQINMVSGAMTWLATTTGIAKGSILALTTVSLAVWGAGIVYSVYRITNALKEATNAQNDLQNALASADVSNDQAIRKLQQVAAAARAAGDTAKAASAANAIRSMTARAEGGPVTANSPYLVGEKGPELYIPNTSGTVIPSDKTQNMLGGNVSLNVNIGLYAGSEMEKRKVAKMLMQAYQEAMA